MAKIEIEIKDIPTISKSVEVIAKHLDSLPQEIKDMIIEHGMEDRGIEVYIEW